MEKNSPQKMKHSNTPYPIKNYKQMKKKIKMKVKVVHMAEISKMLKNRVSKNIWNGVSIVVSSGLFLSHFVHFHTIETTSTVWGRKTTTTDKFKLVDLTSCRVMMSYNLSLLCINLNLYREMKQTNNLCSGFFPKMPG